MIKPFYKNRIGWTLLLAAFVSLLSGFLTYRLLLSAAYDLIDSRIQEPAYLQNEEYNAIQRFQAYISEHRLASTDRTILDAWVDGERYLTLEMYRDDRIIYQSYDMEYDITAEIPVQYPAWKNGYTIIFADGAVTAVIYSYAYMQLYSAAQIACVAAGSLITILLLLLYVHYKARYIVLLSDELKILENGNLEYPITIKGLDELADLAHGIDTMRTAFIERQSSENDAREANRSLVTAMSHDLRSPLTSLTGYLDILRLGKYRDEEQKQHFLESAYRKTAQIKELSDKLFEYFLVYDKGHEPMKLESFDGSTLLAQIIGESVLELETEGFLVDYHPPDAAFVFDANVELLRRAFDNLFTNLRKYADPDHLLSIEAACEEDTLRISFTNRPRQNFSDCESTGIGLKVCEMAMKAHGGRFRQSSTQYCFTAILEFPLSSQLPES